ncbi:innexin unc-7-like [Pomacea canaliculata]|uniref:innexin unc-7-like n=1 Tax=Pomacea canaliculata TaxID=400727 RepID=UPI000D72CC0A|nr:innexin unc-7-like [Pomacea canaliculata]
MGHKPFLDLNTVSSYSWFTLRGEDVASILINRLTCYTLVIIALCLSGVQLVGNAIECWCPAQTTDAQCNYTKSVCWISRVYFIDHAEDGFDLDRMIQSVTSCLAGEKKAELVANNIDLHLQSRQRRRRRWWGPVEAVAEWVSATGVFVLGSGGGTYQTGLFLLTRLLNVVVVALLYPLLSRFLEADFAAWGWYMLRQLIGLEEDADGTEARNVFQRETLCDFRIRQQQNVHVYTVQCVLPLNLWSEKIFLVLWVWLPVLLVASVFCYLDWWRKLVRQGGRRLSCANTCA